MMAQIGPLPSTRFKTIVPLLFYLAGHIVMLSLALNWAAYLFPWKSATIIGLLCGGCLVGVMVEYFRLHSRASIGRLYYDQGGSLLHFQHALSSLIEDWMFGMFVIALVYIPFWCQIIRGHSPFETGAITLSFTGPFLLFQFLLAWMVQDSGPALPFFFPLRLIFSAIAATMAALLTRSESSASMEIGLIVTLGFSLSALLRWPRSVVVPSLHGSPIMEWHYSPLLVSIAHCVFTNRFLIELRRIPGVDQTKAITIFKTDPATYKDPELLAFKKALATVFYVPLVLAGLTFFISLVGFLLHRGRLDFGKLQKEERGIRDASYPFDKSLSAAKHYGNEDHPDRADNEIV